MLVLSRKVEESITIGGAIKIKVHKITGNRVVLGIDAPGELAIVRGELHANDQVATTADRVEVDSIYDDGVCFASAI